MDENDYEFVLKLFSDTNVLNAFNLKSFTKEQMKRWLDRNLEHQQEYGYGLFSVILKSNNEVIGDCGLEHTAFEGNPCVELGYDFLSQYWNKGYATEAALAVRYYANEVLKIEDSSLCSFIRKNNVASQRVSEKIGMRKKKEYTNYGLEYFLYSFSTCTPSV